MTGDPGDRVARILDSYDAKKQKRAEAAQAASDERAEFMERFAQVGNDVIAPAMDEIGQMLKSRGHDFQVSIESEQYESDGKRKPARVIMQVYPEGKRPARSSLPGPISVAFVVDPSQSHVWVSESKVMRSGGWSSGNGGEYPLDEVTEEVVQSHVLGVLEESLS